MLQLEAAWRASELQPVAVVLGAMPPGASRQMRDIADHMRLRMGLRRAVGDDRPLPYAVREAVRAGLVENEAQASRAINRLVRAGVIESAGTLPRRPGMAHATRLYDAPRVDQGSAVPVEVRVLPAVQPAHELPEQPMVDRAVALTGRGTDGVRATERGADGAIEHAAKSTTGGGR